MNKPKTMRQKLAKASIEIKNVGIKQFVGALQQAPLSKRLLFSYMLIFKRFKEDTSGKRPEGNVKIAR